MAVGFPVKDDYATGDVLTAANMNDFAGTLNTVPDTIGAYSAGKNKIINGDFGIWQRGTSFAGLVANAFTADRFLVNTSGATVTVSQQTFTPGTAPVAGYEGRFFLRCEATVANDFVGMVQNIENVQTFAGQTITISFWAKAAAANTLRVYVTQNFGSGGSANLQTQGTPDLTLTTNWARYSVTLAVPSVAGKTIGSGSLLAVQIYNPNNEVSTIDLWGVQAEAGSIATPFQTATGTIQGELAAAQRYYWLIGGGATELALSNFAYFNATDARGVVQFPQTMRVSPTVVSAAGTDYFKFEVNGGTDGLNSLSAVRISPQAAVLFNQTTVSGTAGQAGYLVTNNSLASLAFSAEL
jgi:hypothetical protein